jgi:hypothetical protein
MIRAVPPALLLALLLVPPASAQSSAGADGWDSPRAVELIRMAQARRAETHADTLLRSYRSEARAFLYFYLDREDRGTRNLVKTDQLALEVLWQAPDRVKQRIVGWRDRQSLPTDIHYHLDHLAVVMENFGDEIRIGDGDEVRDVRHPAARDAEGVYEYRLTDSLTLRLPGAEEPVRVYRLQVRPRDLSRPALLGAVYVERRAGDLVRMDFTFTPAAYVDPTVDYINISLDNGLWMGRFWLPNEQRVEIRRKITELDIPAGSVIRGTMRVGSYRFNEAFPAWTFAGPPVVAVPRQQREAFDFEEDIDADLRREGLGPGMELREIRREAQVLARRRSLSGLSNPPVRIPAASEALRYNRAEGLAVGLGRTLLTTSAARATVHAGWAFGAGHPWGELVARGAAPEGWTRFSGYLNRPRDVGIGPAASGAMNTLSALVAGRDHTDLLHASGAAVEAAHGIADGWRLEGGVFLERQRSARLAGEFSLLGGAARPVPPVDPGALLALEAAAVLEPGAERGRWREGALRLRSGMLQHDAGDVDRFSRMVAELGVGGRWSPRETELRLDLSAGGALGRLPRQELFLLGGRGTLPGHPFRGYGGDRFLLGSTTLSADLAAPWVRGRLLGAGGWTGAAGPAGRSLALWGAEPTSGARGSLGAGVGLFHDLLRLDLVRGVGRGGGWELIVETRRSFWDFL